MVTRKTPEDYFGISQQAEVENVEEVKKEKKTLSKELSRVKKEKNDMIERIRNLTRELNRLKGEDNALLRITEEDIKQGGPKVLEQIDMFLAKFGDKIE